MTEIDDQRLFEMLKNDENAYTAFDTLFTRHYEKLCQFAWRYCNNKYLSEDCVTDVWLKIWEKRELIETPENVRAYLYKMVRNKSIDMMQSHSKRSGILGMLDEAMTIADNTNTDDAILQGELNAKINKALKNLPEKASTAFTLHRFEQMSYIQISEILGVSVSSVEKYLIACLKELRSVLKAQD
ncbi:RNA polymerase sigma factor [Aureibacter tunicatorum]|uniref:RNA polymerase sigma-70 factor (ECF subfamily) n=1 Tax=Aureibacter tunicatorum TaxID=866807 RepID=A0AAE3XLR1_9BACT|nr:RNA polymerase sigma-70 factor [Aureibacter tunicatorum]MDR6238762.1 RNA polymerase sigma-70 factor (ECF subfamily) [Aureibacter tunicatorum]BDD05307.1 DNA-directed RNA polymerase sigma-70 factor [Aureibacter tunicatorum]